jgi:hypothetical protein
MAPLFKEWSYEITALNPALETRVGRKKKNFRAFFANASRSTILSRVKEEMQGAARSYAVHLEPGYTLVPS